MDLDENEEIDENGITDDRIGLFPEVSDGQPEELNLEFLQSQESPVSPPLPSYEQKAPSDLPTTQRAPLPPSRPRSRRTPAGYYHPNDYYLGTDWPRVIVGSLVSLLILGGVILLAIYLFEKFDEEDQAPTVIPSQVEEVTSVRVYACAGDSIPINEIEPPSQAFLEGKNAAGTWIAFRDPSSPLNQIWARADELPTLDFGSLTIISCESSEPAPDQNSPLSLETNGEASDRD
tara:strand:- start:603 stop:1301 length:699 start_codon:yes stop_codon:yes gene_type:complete